MGTVFINIIDEPPLGEHPSIQIYLNFANQLRGVGGVAYRLACEQSGHNRVYAHMRKSNTASAKAAEKAGFVDVTPPDAIQQTMMWERTAASG